MYSRMWHVLPQLADPVGVAADFLDHSRDVPLTPGARHSTACRPILLRPRASPGVKLKKPFSVTSFFRYSLNSFNHLAAQGLLARFSSAIPESGGTNT